MDNPHIRRRRRARLVIETYGCQMNIADSQLVNAVLRRAGYAAAAKPEDADVILLNTCAIREHAEERVIGRLSDLARLKHARPEVKLGLLGCMAQHNRAALIEKAPWLDLVAGPDTYRRLPELIGARGYDPAVDVRLDRGETYADLSPDYEAAYARTSRRCADATSSARFAWCRMCAGASAACRRTIIMREVDALAARGVKEVVLLGQTVNAYRFEQIDFAALLRHGRGGRRDRADSLYLAPSERHERVGNRGDGIGAEGPAVPPSAGAVGIRSDARGDGSRLYRARVSRSGRAVARGDSGRSRFRPTSSSASTARTRRDFHATLDLMRTVALRLGLQLQVFGARAHAGLSPRRQVAKKRKGRRLTELIAMQERSRSNAIAR